MSRLLCLLHANCQGDMLLPLLEKTPAFAQRFQVRRYVNFTREPLDAADLERCALFLYQPLGRQWGELSSQALLQRLPPSCTAVPIPNLFFKGYWPFWQSGGPINFTDALLEKLLEKGDSQTALRLYLKGDPALLGDTATLEAIAQDSLAHEEAKEHDAPIRCAPLLRERWRTEQLFLTVNHPCAELVFYVADALLRLLGLGGLPPAVRSAYAHPYNDFWLPIHPGVGTALGLAFASAERRYPLFHNCLTHREYVTAYLACRSLHVADLLTFLRHYSPHRDTSTAR